jgi:mannose-6-phosphate isomerase
VRRAPGNDNVASGDIAAGHVARMTELDLRRPLRPVPAPSYRPWAGTRLGSGGIGELWLAGPDSLVKTGEGESSLEQLAHRHGKSLVGDRGLALLGPRFPLLIKLIDAADWLSLQVHPSDAVAAELHGEGSVGKTEAWVVLAAEPGATLITGPRDDLVEADLRAAIAAGTLGRAECRASEGRPGDTWLIRTGTIHSIGAGLVVFEIEQPSDLTYRISDWGRPAEPGRTLHLSESLRAVVADAHAIPSGSGFRLDDGALTVPEFRLEIVTADVSGTRRRRAPGGRSLEIVTAVGSRVTAAGDGWRETLEVNESLVVPALVAAYELSVEPQAMAFVGSIP